MDTVTDESGFSFIVKISLKSFKRISKYPYNLLINFFAAVFMFGHNSRTWRMPGLNWVHRILNTANWM